MKRNTFPAHCIVHGYRVLGEVAAAEQRWATAEAYLQLSLDTLMNATSMSHPHVLLVTDRLIGVILRQSRQGHAFALAKLFARAWDNHPCPAGIQHYVRGPLGR